MLQKLHLRYAIKCHAYILVLLHFLHSTANKGLGQKERKKSIEAQNKIINIVKANESRKLADNRDRAMDLVARKDEATDDWLWPTEQPSGCLFLPAFYHRRAVTLRN